MCYNFKKGEFVSINVSVKQDTILVNKNEFLQSSIDTSSHNVYKSILDRFIETHSDNDNNDFVLTKNDFITYLDETLKINSKYDKASIYTQKTYVNVIKRFLKILYNNTNDFDVYNLIQYLEEHRRLDLDSISIKPLSFKDFTTARTFLLNDKLKGFTYDESLTIEQNKTLMFSSFIQARNNFALKLVAFAGIRSEEIKTLRINGIRKLKKSYELTLLIHRGKKKYDSRRTKIFMHYIKDEVDFLKSYFEAFGAKDNLIMVSSRNVEYPVCNKDISYLVKKFLSSLNINPPKDSKVGFYLLRHSFGLLICKEGKHIQTIRKKMGLVKTDMAKLYLHYLHTHTW